MSEDEVEAFEINEYDMDSAFNMNRPRRKLTKQQQMLGIWADDESDEEDTKPAGPSSRNFSKGPKNYSAPVNFVAGGVQQAGQPKKENDVDEEEEEEQVEINSSDSEEDELPRGFRGKGQKKFPLYTNADIAGFRKKTRSFNPALAQKGVGSWEVHTKGIGAKLLLQMGFEPGKGLGKALQGINAPVEAHVRRGRGAIGAYGPEKLAKVAKASPPPEDKKPLAPSQKTSQWRKSDAKKKTVYTYKSVDQLLDESKSKTLKTPVAGNDPSKVKVIDCRGPEQKVLSGYHAITNAKQRPDEAVIYIGKKTTSNFSLPELQHNLEVILDLCEEDIVQNNRKMKYFSDRLLVLEEEDAKAEKIKKEREELILRTEHVLKVVETMKESNVGLNEMATEFQKLRDNYSQEYMEFELGELASSMAGDKMKEMFQNWSPLQFPTYPVEIFRKWKGILEEGNKALPSGGMPPWDGLVLTAWMPFLRGAVQEWNCRQPEPLIVLIEEWMPLLPGWILDNVLEVVVLPKLTLEVEEWNSTEDTVPIHTWIHPWLPLMGSRLNTHVYPIIRRKLGSALIRWNPADRTARRMIECWAKVFTDAEMEAFLLKNIVPKLRASLNELEINPSQQDMEHWNRVYEWRNLLPAHVMADMLDKHFFKKWMFVLLHWLNHSPNFDEVTSWYSGWKSTLDAKLLAEPMVKEHFKKALDIMNRAVMNAGPQTLQPGAMEQVSYLTNLERINTPSPQATAAAQSRLERLEEVVGLAPQVPHGLRDLIQKACETRGILFMPIPNRFMENNRPMYKIGKKQAYFDGDVIVISDGRNWFPKTFNDLSAVLDFVQL